MRDRKRIGRFRTLIFFSSVILLVVLFVFGFDFFSQTQSVAHSPTQRAYLVPRDHFQLMTRKPKIVVEDPETQTVLVRMSEDQMLNLAEKIHQHKKKCGGFVDVEEDTKIFTSQEILSQSLKAALMGVGPASEPLVIQSPNTVKATLSRIQIQRFKTFLETFSQFPDRYSKSSSGVDAAELIRSELTQFAQSLNRHDVTAEVIPTPGRIQPSIVFKISGTHPQLQPLLLGAHLDTLPKGLGSVMPGADDDGSGVSTVAEILRVLLETQYQFQRDLYFAFYAAEEVGLVGSKEVVKIFNQRKIYPKAVLQFDMTAFRSSNDKHEIYMIDDYTSDVLTAYIGDLAKKYLDIEVAQTTCGYACSDHANWHQIGIPVAFPFEASFSNFNKSLHTSKDALNLINYDHAKRFIELGVAFTIELAGTYDGNDCLYCRFTPPNL